MKITNVTYQVTLTTDTDETNKEFDELTEAVAFYRQKEYDCDNIKLIKHTHIVEQELISYASNVSL